jgi:hypothetical protein
MFFQPAVQRATPAIFAPKAHAEQANQELNFSRAVTVLI